MNLVKLHVDRFTVVGLEARTTNAQEARGGGPIGKLWARLMTEHFLSAIPHRVDDRIVAVYSNYASDRDGPYTYLLGAKVSSRHDLPPGMTAREIVPGTYAMFTAAGGSPAQMVVGLWKRIWSLEQPGPLQRAYQTDYEVHYNSESDPAGGAHVDVYVGLRDER